MDHNRFIVCLLYIMIKKKNEHKILQTKLQGNNSVLRNQMSFTKKVKQLFEESKAKVKFKIHELEIELSDLST